MNGKQSPAYSTTAILLAMFLWATSFPFVLWALREVPPLTLAFLRYFILIPILLAYMHFETGIRDATRSLRRDWRLLLLLALTTVTLPNIAQNLGMERNQSSSISSILQSSGPLFTVILAMLFLKDRMNWWQWTGMGLGLFGSVLLATNGLQMFGGGTFEGNMLVMFSAITYAFATIFGKRLLGRNRPSTVVGWSNIIGAILLFPPTLVEGCPIPATSSAWLNILGLALLSSFIAYVLWYKVMEYTPVSRLIVTIYLIPVIAVGLSIWWLGERLDAMQVLYAALIIAGVAIAQKTTEKKGSKDDFVEKKDIRRNG